MVEESPTVFLAQDLSRGEGTLGIARVPISSSSQRGRGASGIPLYGRHRIVGYFPRLRCVVIWRPSLVPACPRGKATYVEIHASEMLRNLHLTREHLVDVAILAGTDFHPGVRGLGPKLALKLIQRYGSIENLPGGVKNHYGFSALPSAKVEEVRGLFLAPDVCVDVPDPVWRAPSREALVRLCCREHHLDEQRVSQAVERWVKSLKRAPKAVAARRF